MERCLGCMNEYDASFDVCPHCGYVKGTAEKSKNHLAPGTTLIGRYLIGRCLGQGGFGITYIAWDQRLYKKVAIKEFMPTSLASRITGQMDITCYNDEAQERFQNGIRRMLDESRRLAQFNDLESVVRVYDCFEANQTAYIIMELLDGENVETILSRQKTMDLYDTAKIMLPVLQALREIHATGLIHRDISPDNIVVCKNGKVKLLDFGSARVASGSDDKSLSVILKPGYAPKEQYSAMAKQGPYTDVYAVCATIYRMLTGVKPIDSLERHVQDDKLAPIETLAAVPKVLAQAIGHGLAIEPANRMQTVDPLLTAFQSIIDGRTLPPQKPAKPAKTKSGKSSKTWLKIVLPVLALLLVGAAVFFAGNHFDWWDTLQNKTPVIDPTDARTEYQQALLEKAAAGTVPAEMLPAAEDRAELEKTYARTCTYTADDGLLYAEFKDADGRPVLREQILLPKNETDAFTMFTYTESGEPKAVVEYLADGSVGDATCYYYDQDGTLFVTAAYENGKLQNTTEYAPVKDSDEKLPSVIRSSDKTEVRVEYSTKGLDTIEKHFDKSGNKVYERVEYAQLRRIRTALYDKDDDPTQVTVVNLDADGRKINYEETGYGGVFVTKYVWEYDSQGRATHFAVIGEDGLQQSGYQFTYVPTGLHYIMKEDAADGSGNVIREYAYDVIKNSYITYDYNTNGKMTARTSYSAYEKQDGKTTWTYDAEDRVTQKETFDEKNETVEVCKDYVYETGYATDGSRYDDAVNGYTVYDAEGKKTYSILEADAGSKYYAVRTEYDAKQRQTHFTAEVNEVLREEIVTSYSSDGRRETQTLYDENSSIVNKWATEYDKDGGVTSEEEYDTNGVLRIKRNYTGIHPTELFIYNADGSMTDHYVLEDRVLVGQVIRHYDGNGTFKEQFPEDRLDWHPSIPD
ncbi:MAG: protein kinase [Clostridia bacterium]|nr:protein kinase [Clostridia bacterium]